MKHLAILLTMAITLTGLAQNNFIQEYPWNPDSDNDDFIGVGDLTGFLSVFGQQFGTPPEPCDYDGTPIEEWFSGLITGDIILDSMFIEFQLLDSSLVYYPGCPDPVMEVVELHFSDMMTNVGWNNSPWSSSSYLGGQYLAVFESFSDLVIGFHYSGLGGQYHLFSYYNALSVAGYSSDGLFGTGNWFSSGAITLPFGPENSFDENGLSFDPSIWSSNNWPHYASYITLLPYWHYAE